MLPETLFKHILWSILLCSVFELYSTPLAQSKKDHYRIMFYNVENLFDTFNDPLTNDDEFTPGGDKGWTNYRYQKKLNDLAKVIIAAGEWTPPSIIGLCEVENFQVLLDLTTKTPLARLGYRIIHENSNDERGIDVALLYRAQDVKRIEHLKLANKRNSQFSTRDILWAKMEFPGSDTLHVFINHWPSRFGGKETTENKRMDMAYTLRTYIDSLKKFESNPKILIMGDFNDEPNDRSISEVLDAAQLKSDIQINGLYNFSYPDFLDNTGTIVYREINNTWFLFDQIIVSGTLIISDGLVTNGNKSTIFADPWMLKDNKPFRTYQGPIYLGGYSDHLPIFIDLHFNE